MRAFMNYNKQACCSILLGEEKTVYTPYEISLR